MFSVLRNKPILVGLGVAAASAVLPLDLASAGTATTTFQVTATVQATCLISATDLAFGTYSGAQVDATSTITVTCTATTPWNIGLNAGLCPGGTVTTRCMQAGAATLNYAMYRDAARSLNWGNTVGTDTLSGTGSGSAQNNTVYGRVAGSQYPAPGGYADTITATVTF